jgi:hypothetical protein
MGNPMPHNPRPQMQVLQRQEQVAKLYAQGYTQTQLAVLTGTSQSTIQRDIEAIEQRWQQDALQHHSARKNRLLAELVLARAAAWEGWQRSLELRETTVTEAVEGGPGATRRTARVRKEAQGGGCTFLSEIGQSILDEAKMRGLMPPDKLRVDFEQLTEAQILRLSRGEPYESVVPPPAPMPPTYH